MNFDIPDRFRRMIHFVYCRSCNQRLHDAVQAIDLLLTEWVRRRMGQEGHLNEQQNQGT